MAVNLDENFNCQSHMNHLFGKSSVKERKLQNYPSPSGWGGADYSHRKRRQGWLHKYPRDGSVATPREDEWPHGDPK